MRVKNMELADMVKSRRKQLGLTQQQVADAVGVSKSTVCQWENGYIADIKRDKIYNLSKVLQIHLEDIFTTYDTPIVRDPMTRELLRRMADAPEELRAAINAFADSLLKSQGY